MMNKREPYNPLLKSYPDSEKINAVSEGAETLFTRLIAQSDDANHYYGDAPMVLGKLYTRRMALGQVNVKAVQTRIDELADARLIEIYEADGRHYIEIVNCRKDLRSDTKPDIRFPSKGTNDIGPNPGRIRAGIRETFDPLTQPNPTQPNRPEPIKPAPVPGEAVLPAGFSRFWKAWPKHFRKQGRSKCVAHWKREKLEPIADAVVSTLERFKNCHDWTKEGGEYIPFPMTWLNRTPWETDAQDLVDPFAGTAPTPERDWG
jgi:hypothetical protein